MTFIQDLKPSCRLSGCERPATFCVEVGVLVYAFCQEHAIEWDESEEKFHGWGYANATNMAQYRENQHAALRKFLGRKRE